MKVMLDEMFSPRIVPRLWDEGVDTICVRDRDLLSASDGRIWRYAQAEARAFVTGNIAHFERLARTTDTHYGIIGLPAGGTSDMQFSRVMAGVNFARNMSNDQPSLMDLIAYVDEDGNVNARILSATNDNAILLGRQQPAKIISLN